MNGIEEMKQAIASVDFSDIHALSSLIYQPSSDGGVLLMFNYFFLCEKITKISSVE